MAGFSRNSGGNPYLVQESFRETLFPGAPQSAVLPTAQAQPILEKMRLATIGEELDVLDINLVPMDDLSAEEGHVSTVDPLFVAPQPDREQLVSGSELSNDDASFSGFTETSASGYETMPQQSVKAALSDKKSQHRQSKSHHSSSGPKKAKRSSHKSGSKRTDSQVEAQVVSFEPQPSGSGPPVIQTNPPAPQFDMNSMVATILQSIQPQLDRLQSQIQSLGRSEEALMPPVSSLPPFDESNPWRSALRAPCQNNMLTIEGVGTRPLTDFEVFPPNGVFPNVYVRLSQSASIREDKVPKETVLYPVNKAQGLLIQLLKRGNCLNTKMIPTKGNLTIFTTPSDFPNPFATKMLEAAEQAFKDDKEGPALKEEDLTSLLFPADSEGWKNVAATFTGSKLSPDCFSQQFNESLPKLTDGLINKEFDVRSRLARTLHTFTLTEYLMSLYPELDMLKIIVKSMCASLRKDLTDFMLVRKTCRKHLFLLAEVRHEPTKLINAPVWGVHLFPPAMVQEAVDNAAKMNLSLRRRWGMFEKRKFTEGSGPQPKNKKYKKDKQGNQQSQQAQKPQSDVAVSSTQSPAYNPAYEGNAYSFRARGYYQQRGGRRGGYGRGRGRFYHFQHRGRASQRRGAQRRGGARGRGSHSEQSQ